MSLQSTRRSWRRCRGGRGGRRHGRRHCHQRRQCRQRRLLSVLDRGQRRVRRACRWRSKARASAHLRTAPDLSATATTSNPQRGEGGGGGSLAPWGTATMAAPINLIVAGRCDHRRHHCHRCCRRLSQLGGEGRGWRGHPPSVVVFADVVGGGGAVPAAERAPLNVVPSHPDPSRRPSSISPSLSSRPHPTHYLLLPPPTLVDC